MPSQPDFYARNHKLEVPKSQDSSQSRLLVLCIDRDDDIGTKGGIETPIVGRDQCINAGTRLAIEDPEDADGNAIFGAVKTYEELVSKGYNVEVAVVAGKFNRGVEADEKISREVQAILEKYNATGAVIVSDGEDDETVLPVIQSRVPVVSVQRIIIRHSRSVEYSYAVLGRYLKAMMYDPQYSKFFLGVPGTLLLAGGLAVAFDATKWLTVMILAILGGAFMVRAFDVDRAIGSLGKMGPTDFIKIFSVIGGVLMMLAAIANGISSIPHDIPVSQMDALQLISNKTVVGSFAKGMITMMWIGIATVMAGVLLSNWLKGSTHAMADILRLVVLGLLYIPVLQFTDVLTLGTSPFTLVSSLLIGLAVSLVAAAFLYQHFRHKRGGEQVNNNNNNNNNKSEQLK
jgi:putative membrane protein